MTKMDLFATIILSVPITILLFLILPQGLAWYQGMSVGAVSTMISTAWVAYIRGGF